MLATSFGKACDPRVNELNSAEQSGEIRVLLSHVGFIGPDAAVQPGDEIDIIGNTPTQLLRGVDMSVDEAREQDATIEVEYGGVVRDGGEAAEDGVGMADGYDFVAFEYDCSLLEHSQLRIHRYDHGVVEDTHLAASAHLP